MKRGVGVRTSWAIGVLLVALPLILYWPFVFGGQTLFWGTPLLQFWPWRHFAAGELHAGRIPLWNPYAGNGGPLLADHQSAVLYLLNLIFWLLPVERAMGLSLVIHAMLAGGAMYALARDLEVSRLGSLVAALAFMFSGYMVARGSFLTEISALPWLPLLWLFGGRLVRRRRWSDAALLQVAIALQFLAGHAQTWFYSLCALGLYGLWQGWRSARSPIQTRSPSEAQSSIAARPSSLHHRWPFVGRAVRRAARTVIRCLPLGIAVACGVALAGAQFLPTLELSHMAGRGGREGWETFALQYSLWPWRLITLLLPDFFGNPANGDYWGYATYWEDVGYIGVIPFLFAALAIVAWLRWRRRPSVPPALAEVPFWAGLALFALLMALGQNTPFYMFFFRAIPGFDSFQAPARWLCIYTPAMALLAGVGIDALRPSRRLTFVCRLGVAGAVAIALTTVAARSLLSAAEITFFDPMIGFAVWLAAAMLLLLWGQRVRKGKGFQLGPIGLGDAAWAGGLVLVVAGDLITAGWHLNPAIDPALYAPRTEIGQFLAADGPRGRTFSFADGREEVMFGRYLDFGDYGPSEVGHWWGMREALLPDLGMVERLPSANSFEPLVEGRAFALLQALEDLPRERALRVLGMMHVAYVLDPAPDLGAEILNRSPSVNVYGNPYLRPRAYVVPEARIVDTPQAALSAVTAPDFDPARQVILEQSTGEGLFWLLLAAEHNPPPIARLATGLFVRALGSSGKAGAMQTSTIPARGRDSSDGGYGKPPYIAKDGPNPVSGRLAKAVAEPSVTLLPSPPNQVRIEAVLSQPGYLVLADTYYPGWQAFVDGQRAEILRANYAFRALALDAGEHEVYFRYRPRSFMLGGVISIVAAVEVMLCLAFSIGVRKAKR